VEAGGESPVKVAEAMSERSLEEVKAATDCETAGGGFRQADTVRTRFGSFDAAAALCYCTSDSTMGDGEGRLGRSGEMGLIEAHLYDGLAPRVV